MKILFRSNFLIFFLFLYTFYSCSFTEDIDEKSSNQELIFKNTSNDDIHIFYELYYIQLGELSYTNQEDFDSSNKLTPGKTRSVQNHLTWSEDKYPKIYHYNFWAGRNGEVLGSIVDYKINHEKNNKFTVTWDGSKLKLN